MTRKRLLSAMEKPVRPSQVYVEHSSSRVLKKPQAISSVFTQNRKEKEGKTCKNSSYRQFKKGQHIVSTSTHQDVRPLLIRSGHQGYGEISQSQLFHSPVNNITILGKPVGLSPHPGSQLNKASQPRLRLPQLAKGSKDGENSKKKLCIFTAIKPSNVESEKAKFFKSDFRYDPQFEYSNPAPLHILEKHNKASDHFLTQVTVYL